MTTKRFNIHAYRRQKGAVLAIGLLILLVMTIMAISGMETSIMGERMASNAENVNRSFQAAETTVSVAVNNDAWINKTLAQCGLPNPNWPQETVELASIKATGVVNLSCKQTIMRGYSFGATNSTKNYQLHVDSAATLTDSNSETRLVQGFIRMGAG